MLQGEETVERLQNKIHSWMQEIQEKTGEKAPKTLLETNENYIKLHQLLRANAKRLEGGCAYFIMRRKRFCSSQKGIASEFCSLHERHENIDHHLEPENSNNTRQDTNVSEGKKTNLKRRMKRCLNPFVVGPLKEPIIWKSHFDDLSRPLFLDIGCAKGGYIRNIHKYLQKTSDSELLKHGWNNQHWNLIGIELYKALVDSANTETAHLKNLTYIHANINASLDLLSFPNLLSRVSFMFPDPWACGLNANKKNVKRRVMSSEFALRLANCIHVGGQLYFASDWHELALDIRTKLLATGLFSIPPLSSDLSPTKTAHDLRSLQPVPVEKRSDARLIDVAQEYEKPILEISQEKWLDFIPWGGIKTERDLVCETQWRIVYRLVLERNK